MGSSDTDDDRFLRNAAGKVDAERPTSLAFDTGWSFPALIGSVALIAIFQLTGNVPWASVAAFSGLLVSAVLLIRRSLRQRRYRNRRRAASQSNVAPLVLRAGRRQRVVIGLLAVVGGLGALIVSLHRVGLLR